MRVLVLLALLVLVLFISGCTQTVEREVIIEPAESSNVVLPNLEKDVGVVEVGEEDSQRNFFVQIINKIFEGLSS